MDNLNQWTADQLLTLHNSLCAKEDYIDGPWKKSKRVLIERIRSRGETAQYDHRFSVADNEVIQNAISITGLVKSLVKTKLNYSEIVDIVRDRFPGSRTTTRSVASIASLQRSQNSKVPFRRISS